MSLNVCADCMCTFDEIVENPRNCDCGCHKRGFKNLREVMEAAVWVDGVGVPVKHGVVKS